MSGRPQPGRTSAVRRPPRRLARTTFPVLRLSTLLLSCGTALLLWWTLDSLGVPMRARAILLLTWILNPIQFCLSFTFMTEVRFSFHHARDSLYVLWLSRGRHGSWRHPQRRSDMPTYPADGVALHGRPDSQPRLAARPERAARQGRQGRGLRGDRWGFRGGLPVLDRVFPSVTPALQRKFTSSACSRRSSWPATSSDCCLCRFHAAALSPGAAQLWHLFQTAGTARSLLAGGFWSAWPWRGPGGSIPVFPARLICRRGRSQPMPYLLNVLMTRGLDR